MRVGQVVPQPTGGFDELQVSYNGGQWCGNRAQGVCGTDGSIVCTIDADCDLTGGICQGGSNGGNACTSDAQCPGSGLCSTTCGNLVHDPILFTCCRDGDQVGHACCMLLFSSIFGGKLTRGPPSCSLVRACLYFRIQMRGITSLPWVSCKTRRRWRSVRATTGATTGACTSSRAIYAA